MKHCACHYQRSGYPHPVVHVLFPEGVELAPNEFDLRNVFLLHVFSQTPDLAKKIPGFCFPYFKK